MHDCNYKPDGTGVVMGDTKPMPDRGSSTGMTGVMTEMDGTGVGQDDTNAMGQVSGTDSDAWDKCYSSDPTFGDKGGSGKGSY